MTKVTPVVAGVALAATVGIGYAVCTLLFWLWPEAAAGFMNALFHGLDFRKLQSGPALFNFSSFLWSLVVMMLWAYGMGTVFGLVLERLAHD
jgi:hypothetical protein